MSDDDLLTTIRTQFTDVRLTSPLASVVARGRQLRRRRTWPVLGAGTGAVAAVAALAFGLATPASGPGGTHVVLDAWSVVSKPDGTVSLTIRDQRESSHDRARLAKALRQAGVPALVQTALPRACLPAARGQQGITISRHPGTVTITFKISKLSKRVQIGIVIPAVVVSEGSGASRRVEVRVRPAAVRAMHANAKGLRLPQVVVLAPSPLCPTATPKGGR